MDGTGVDSALSRSGLSQRQIDTLVDAFNAGKVRTQLVVMKPKHLGAGVTKGMANHKQLGAGSGLPLNDIVIIEMGN